MSIEALDKDKNNNNSSKWKNRAIWMRIEKEQINLDEKN
jgi:hypothetical protein